MSRVLIVEGQGGAAKTPLCHRLIAKLAGAVYVHPFHEVAAAVGHDVYSLWAEKPQRALSLLRDVILAPREAEIIVFDRVWLTICRGLEGFGHSELLCEVQPLMGWTAFVDQDEEYVRARSARLAAHGMPPWDLHEDFMARRRWAQDCDWVGHLDGDANLDAVAVEISVAWQSSVGNDPD